MGGGSDWRGTVGGGGGFQLVGQADLEDGLGELELGHLALDSLLELLGGLAAAVGEVAGGGKDGLEGGVVGSARLG